MRKVAVAEAAEVESVDAWSRGELETLIGIAREHEPASAPQLVVLFNAGMRRGEVLGLQWADVLGHSDPTLTLRVYTHAMRSEEEDVDFADFGGAGRRYTAMVELGAEDEAANPA